MSKPFPPDDDLGPEMTALEAFTRAMRIKLEDNRRARASKASEKSARPGEPSGPFVGGPISAEELDQAILDRHPELTKEDLARIAKIT
jgi:hypothetical protein